MGILNQRSQIRGQMIDWQFFKNIFSTLWKPRKSTNLIKFRQSFQFPTFVTFFAKQIKNKILRNVPSWQFFVFVTVFKKFGFEICNFKHWSCNILERYIYWTQLSYCYDVTAVLPIGENFVQSRHGSWTDLKISTSLTLEISQISQNSSPIKPHQSSHFIIYQTLFCIICNFFSIIRNSI